MEIVSNRIVDESLLHLWLPLCLISENNIVIPFAFEFSRCYLGGKEWIPNERCLFKLHFFLRLGFFLFLLLESFTLGSNFGQFGL